MGDALTEQVLDYLVKSAGYHHEPLRVTNEFFTLVKRMPPGFQTGPAIPVGPEVVVVSDGTENVKLIDGTWSFVPSSKPAS